MLEHDPTPAPSPEQLAAYLDGELDAVARAQVARWLAQHPAAAAQLESQRSTERACQSTPPPEPSEAAWDGVLKRIDERTQVIRAAQMQAARSASRRRRWLRIGAATAAAAAMLVVLLYQPTDPVKPVTKQQPSNPLVVATDADVDIISMEGPDIRYLVIGTTPLRGRINWAEADDVVDVKVLADGTNDMEPKMYDGSKTPMLVPLALAKAP